MARRRVGTTVSAAQLSSGHVAGAAVGLAVAGMITGVVLLFASDYPSVGWLVFILSFGGWLTAALLALREAWHRGWFDR
jgi:hypothetical protein